MAIIELSPEDRADYQEYLDKNALRLMEDTVRHLRGMLEACARDLETAKARPDLIGFKSQDIQKSILWNAWNTGLAEMVSAGATAAAWRSVTE